MEDFELAPLHAIDKALKAYLDGTSGVSICKKYVYDAKSKIDSPTELETTFNHYCSIIEYSIAR